MSSCITLLRQKCPSLVQLCDEASSPGDSRKTCFFTTDTFCHRSGDFPQSQQSVVENYTFKTSSKVLSPSVASQQVFTVSHNMHNAACVFITCKLANQRYFYMTMRKRTNRTNQFEDLIPNSSPVHLFPFCKRKVWGIG